MLNIVNKFKSEIEKLKNEIMAQTLKVQLENGEILTIHEDDLLELFVEAIHYCLVASKNGEVITEHRDGINLSETAEKLQGAVAGQYKVIDIISDMLGGEGN